MRTRSVLFAVLLLIAAVGCGGGENGDAGSAAGAASNEKVLEAVEIQKAINADAGRAEEILQEHDMTIDDYEDLMAEISADPELSRSFNELLEQ
ncbi:MAG: hypothetical protein OER88_08820 [Planctomycetota bacterium]|nr:hypothetical protein [Planctomycetota bacterium]